MKRKDMTALVILGVISAIVAFVISGIVFQANSKKEKVPTVEAINENFPNVLNEADYKVIFNNKALDPTQPIQIQGNNNTNPFVGN